MANFLERQSSTAISALGVIGVSCVGILDLVTGNELAFSFFYLIPVATVGWFGSLTMAFVVAVLGGLAFPVTQSINGYIYDSVWVLGWNFAVRSGTYATVAILTATLRRSLDHEKTLARTDSLTGAANPRHFYDFAQIELGRAKRSGRPLTIAYLDVDNLKLINDDYGHAAGDDLLRRVAVSLSRETRPTDLVARLGGDEFALLLPETDPEAALAILNRICDAHRDALRSLDHRTTASIGAVTFTKIPASVDELLWLPDQLMYAAKRGGGDAFTHHVVHDGELDETVGDVRQASPGA